MTPKNAEKMVLDILMEKDLMLTIGEITHKVRQRIGAYRKLRTDVRMAVKSLYAADKIERFFLGHHTSKLTGVTIAPKWGYRIPREKWYYGG